MSSGIAENAWGSFIPGIVKPDPSAYGGRAVRKGGRYNAFVPPDIATYSFTLDQGTIRDVQ